MALITPKLSRARSQWSKAITTPITIAPGAYYNLFESLTEADRSGFSSLYGDLSLKLTEDGAGENFVKYNFIGAEDIIIRVSLGLDQGGTDFYEFGIRRKSDDSKVFSVSFAVRGANMDGALLYSGIQGEDDPFITGGHYVTLENTSQQPVDIETEIKVLISRARHDLR
jgi:hypothetical protein